MKVFINYWQDCKDVRSWILLGLIPVVVVLLACGGCAWVGWRLFVYPATPAGQKAHVEGRRDRADEIDQVTGGRVEVVVSAHTGICCKQLSLDKRWLYWTVGEGRGTYLLNLETGKQIDISHISHLSWVNAEYLWHHGEGNLVHVPDLLTRHLNPITEEEQVLRTFEKAHDVHYLSDSYLMLSLDPQTPYYARVLSLTPEMKNRVTYILVEHKLPVNGPLSPDGSLIAVVANAPEGQGFEYLSIRTPDGREVASVYKKAWTPVVMGWGPDSRTLYFYEATLGASSDIVWPERPVHKLIVDYSPTVTPTPSTGDSTGSPHGSGQAPSSEGCVPGMA